MVSSTILNSPSNDVIMPHICHLAQILTFVVRCNFVDGAFCHGFANIATFSKKNLQKYIAPLLRHGACRLG